MPSLGAQKASQSFLDIFEPAVVRICNRNVVIRKISPGTNAWSGSF